MIKKSKDNLDEILVEALKNHKKNNFKVALSLYNKILNFNPNYVNAYINLGILFNQLGDFSKSISSFKKAIVLNPQNLEANTNLGVLFNQSKAYKKAIFHFEKVIQINPNYVAAHFNLGNTYKELKDYTKAIKSYNDTLLINPEYIDAYNNLGNIFAQLGKKQEAFKCYKKAILINPNYFEGYNNLGNIFKKMNKYNDAKQCYEKAIYINSNFVDAYNNLGNIFKQMGEHEKAINSYDKAELIDLGNLKAYWLSMNTFPIVYKNHDEIRYYSKRFEKNIDRINSLLDSNYQYSKESLFDALNSSTNFYLHYQGNDVLELQKKYAALIEKITNKIYPKFHQKKKLNYSNDVIKIGFVSSFFRKHTVSKLFKNWMIKLDKKYFSKYIYYCEDKFDEITNKIKDNVDNFFSNTDIDLVINKIYSDNLDVLIYLDIGMRPKIQILSSLRLAPIQCNTWGHPVTSGFKNIDYYLSSELMETQNSQAYYSEKLITLPGLGINYEVPNLSKIQKPIISKNLNSIIFLNLQSLFKLLPNDDHIYLDIVKKYSNCCFWFIQEKEDSVTNIFKQRLRKLFENQELDFERYFYFHPKCSEDEFFGLIEESDIILDSLNWSGGNTSLEAISLNKPIVTCPSQFMRGRHTYAILKTLGIDETIAISKDNYVEISVKLASDVNYRNLIINKIRKNKKKIFNDDKPIRFIEDFIKKLYENKKI